jgi:hypothetical protein
VTTMYDLPELRPFRTIAHRMRLAGGAVVTENGRLESDDFDGTTFAADDSTTGWAIYGNGDVVFNSGVFRGTIEADSFRTNAELLIYENFVSSTGVWEAQVPADVTVSTTMVSPIGSGPSLLVVPDPGASPTIVTSWMPASPGSIYYAEIICDAADPDAAAGAGQAQMSISFREAPGIALGVTWIARGYPRKQSGVYGLGVYAKAPPSTTEMQVSVVAATSLTYRADDFYLYECGSITGGIIDTRPASDAPGVRADTAVRVYGDGLLGSGPATLAVAWHKATVAEPWSGGGGMLTSGLLSGETTEGQFHLISETGGATTAALEVDDAYLYVEQLFLGQVNPTLNVLGAWVSYTPSLTSFTLGNGGMVAAYMLIGKICHFCINITLGTTSSITGSCRFGVPFPPARTNIPCHATYHEAPGRAWVGAGSILTGTNNIALLHTETGNSGQVNATNPFTWSDPDIMCIGGTYEIA